MDVLENYKKAWENQPEEIDKVSKVDIYKMAHSRSSSIVKWIFIIGILEFIFWGTINLLIPESYLDMYKKLNLLTTLMVITFIHYIAIVVFLFLFYKNYKSISVFDNTKTLLSNIINTRKTVKYYVYYNLILMVISYFIIFLLMINNLDVLMEYYNSIGTKVKNEKTLIISIIITTIIIAGGMLLLLWLFYKLIYGVLLKKLNKNYKELAKIDELN